MASEQVENEVLSRLASGDQTDRKGTIAREVGIATPTSDLSAPTFSAADATGAEDSAIALGLSLASPDATNITIAGAPAGAALSAGIDNGDGTRTLQAEETDGPLFTPPTDFYGDVTMTVGATTSQTLEVAMIPLLFISRRRRERTSVPEHGMKP